MIRRPIPPILALLALYPAYAAAQDVPPPVRTAAACAPVGIPAPAQAPRVVAPASVTKSMFGVGEVVAINMGTDNGVRPGDEYVVRRPMQFQGAPHAQFTQGRLRVTAATADSALAQIEVSCDAIAVGDLLEPYAALTLSPDITRTFVGGTIDRQHAIHVSYGNDRRSVFGDRDFILAQGGQQQGVIAGARYAALRQGSDPNEMPLGEAVVVEVFADQSLLRMTQARQEVEAGDILALRVGAIDPNPVRTTAIAPAAESANRASAAAVTIDRDDIRASSPADHQSVTFEDVHFALDRFALRPEARAILDAAVTTLQANPALRVQIEGHTCNIGTAEYNLALGQKRADTVRDYLVAHGIAKDRLTTVSYGEEKPAYDNSREATRRLNRRAALVVDIHP